MSEFAKMRDSWCKEQIKDYKKEELLPVYKTTGMRDCIMDWWRGCDGGDHGYAYGWKSLHYYLRETTEPTGVRGERKFREGDRTAHRDICQVCSYFEQSYSRTSKRIEAYNIYLCTDGRIRYWYDEEKEREISKAMHKEWELERRAHEKAMAKSGFRYDPERYCWINDETGEEWGE